VDEAIILMGEIARPNVKLMFDTFHAIYRNEPQADYARRMGTDLVHIHVSGPDRTAPGMGDTDFRPLVRVLKEMGYQGYLVQETTFNSRASDPDVFALQGYEYLKGIIQET